MSHPDVFVFQGTLPPPYSSAAPSEASCSLSSPVSTMTSQSSASSLAKHRQSWLDLVSQASPPAGETAVVCSAQVHSQQQLPREEAEERGEEEVDGGPQVMESSVHRGPSIVASNEEHTAAEGEAQQESSGAQDEGETWCFSTFKIWPDIPFVKLLCNIFIGFLRELCVNLD